MAISVSSYGPFGLLAVFFLVCSSFYIASAYRAWYRLKHVPGPFLASFSYLWLGRVALSGTQHDEFIKVAQQYGPLVRIGPNDLMTDDPELLRRMSNAKSCYWKSDWYEGIRLNPYHPTMFITRKPSDHDKIKANLSPGYNARDTDDMEMAIDCQVLNLVDLIQRKYITSSGQDDSLDLTRVLPLFTLDVISKLSLGREFGCLQTDSDYHEFYTTMETFLPTLPLFTDVRWLRKVVYSSLGLRLFGPKQTDSQGLGKIMGMVNREVRKRFATGPEDGQDILASFIRHGLTQTECEAELLFMYTAGADTVASVMRLTMLHILATPRVYQRLKEEVTAAIRRGVSHPITQAEAKGLPYLQAVIYEGLRMRPATTALVPKEVPRAGDTIDGQFFPGGTSIATNFSSLLRSKVMFGEDADLFRPERFLDPKVDRADMQRDVELTFGYGRWMCAGRPIAFMELNKTYFELFREFDFQIVHPQRPMTTESRTLFMDKDLLVRATRSHSGVKPGKARLDI